MKKRNIAVMITVIATLVMTGSCLMIAKIVKEALLEVDVPRAQAMSMGYSALIFMVLVAAFTIIMQVTKLIEHRPDMYKYDVPMAMLKECSEKVKIQQDKNELYAAMVQALLHEYEVLYFVNLDTEDYLKYKLHREYGLLWFDEQRHYFFTDLYRYLIRRADKNDIDMLSEALTKERITSELKKDDSFTIKFRAVRFGVTNYYILKATYFMNENSNHLIVGIENLNTSIQDETEYKEAVGQAIEMAVIDDLTGVKNRNAYVKHEHELDMLIENEKNAEFAFVVLDVNGLKHVNDTKGHKAGDALLKEASSLVCSVFEGNDIYRIGGDEFTVILLNDAYKNRNELLDKFRERVHSNLRNGGVVVASGLSEYEKDVDRNAEAVFDRADAQMYKNKTELKMSVFKND